MLQRSSLTTPIATDIAGSLQQTLERSALRSLQNSLQLPKNWQQYLILLIVMLMIGAGMVVQVLLAVQIAEAQAMARSLRMEYQSIQFENSELIYQIATRSSLGQVQRRAEELGYIPATSRTFVYRNNELAASPEHGQPAVGAASVAPVSTAGHQAEPWWQPAQAWLTEGLAGLAHFASGWTGQGGADDRFSSP